MGLFRWNLDEERLDKNMFTVSEKRQAELDAAVREGNEIVAVCSQQLEKIPEAFFNISEVSYCITSGGRDIYDLKRGERIYVEYISQADVEYLLYLGSNFPVVVELLVDGKTVIASSFEKLSVLNDKGRLAKLRLLGKEKVKIAGAVEKIILNYDVNNKVFLEFLIYLIGRNSGLELFDDGQGQIELYRKGTCVEMALQQLDYYISHKPSRFIF